MSLRFVPNNGAKSEVSATSFGDAVPSTGLHDSLRNEGGPVSIAARINNKHPLQARLEQWDKTQSDFKLEQLRRNYGAGEPIRRAMEAEIVKATTHPALDVLGGVKHHSVHSEILSNRETDIEWEDVYVGAPETVSGALDFHSQLGKRMGV